MNILFDIYQQIAIRQAVEKVDQAKTTVDRLRDEIRVLSNRCDTLALVCQSLWEILKEQTGMDDAQILKKMQEIDLRDGVADGKITGRPISCPSCGRTNNTRRPTCIYCGHDLPSDTVI
ncbi:MAG: hypothetical protein N2487_01775 [Verrucomicrobiae bacterium]|nr:hypothetical protein [Verrucomicrobiae bacterium]